MNIEQHPLESCMTAEGVKAFSERNLEQAKNIRTTIANTTPDLLTWESTFGAFDDMYFFAREAGTLPNLIKETHPDAKTREAAASTEAALSEFSTELYLDQSVFDVLHAYTETHPVLPPHRIRFMNEVLTDYKRNGLGLPPDKQQILRDLNKRLTDLSIAFDENLKEAPSIKLKPEQLEGLSQDFLDQHPIGEDGLIELTTDTPSYIPFMRDAKDRDAAYTFASIRDGRSKTNLPLLKEFIELRKQKAHLLGFANWADYVLEPRMAKDAKTVAAFLEDLHHGLIKPRDEERVLFNTKAKELGLPHDQDLRASDLSYLLELLKKERFQLNSQEISQYFEVNAVKKGILDVAETLYGIQFQLQPKQGIHEDVETYAVIEKGESIGTIHLDLYPRSDKFKHMAVFSMRASKQTSEGKIRPMCSLVCNFPKTTESAPGLLTHDDVTTFFHEMGHAIHAILGQTELSSQSGTSVARDFVEVPSQLFEKWAWDQTVLNRFAKHFKTQEPLPTHLFQALKAAETFGEATFTQRQLFFATLDHLYHTLPEVENTTKLYNQLYPSFLPYKRNTEVSPEANFGHLNGYDAAYYGYQWALAIAHDVGTRFDQEGLINPSTGAAYREAILSQGDSADGYELVERFLGRKPNNEAYKRYLGLV